MSAIPFIRQGGGNLPFQFDLSGESLAGFILTIKVKKRPEDIDLISRQVEPIGNIWSGYLTVDETAVLPPGRYELIGIISNPATLEGQEIPRRFQIVSSWVQ